MWSYDYSELFTEAAVNAYGMKNLCLMMNIKHASLLAEYLEL